MNLVLLSDIFGMGKSIKTTWISIWLSLNNAVYSVVEVLYKVFMSVAEVNLFSREAFEKITGRVYVVIGIAMLFIFAYNLILMIINPDDKKGTGQMTKLVKETIITLVLIVLLPTIFNYMSVFQKHILDSNIIGQIIMGGVGGASKQDCEKYSTYDVLTTNGIDSSKVNSLKDVCTGYNSLDSKYKGASSIPSTLFSAFFHPSSYGYYECADYVEKCSGKSYAACQTSRVSTENDAEICAHYYYDVELSKFKGSLTPFDDTLFIDKVVDANDDSFEFNYLLAFVSGCFALYMFACYTLAIGVRVAKLGFLQILSPVASMMRIIPKKKEAIFDKWLKNVIDTYLDVFIRLAIIYFALFAISLVPDVIDTLLTSFESLYTVKLLSIVVVILGILKFAQEAPKLLKEFFGSGDRFSLKSPVKQLSENSGVNALRGGVYGATTGKGFWGKVGGFVSGAGRGAVGGYDKAVKGLDTARTERLNGSGFFGRQLDRTRMAVGMETRGDRDDRQVNRWNEKLKISREDEKKLKAIKDMATNAITKETSKVKFDGFNFEGVDFSNMKYTQVKEYENVLRSAYENTQAVEDKEEAYRKLIAFQNQFGEEMKKKTEAGVQALIRGTNSGYYDGVFTATDFSTASSNLADVISNDHDEIDKIENYQEFDDAIKALGKNNQRLSESISNVTTKKGYQARKADTRMVKNQGQSEKK